MVDNNYYLYLRPVCESDLEIIHAWQLNPTIANSFDIPDNNPNTWSDTLAWWRGLGNRMMFMLMVVDQVHSATFWRGREIGVSWVANLKLEVPEIGGYIGNLDYLTTKNIIELYMLTLETVNRLRGVEKASLKVKKDNQELLGVLGKMGWTLTCELEDGMVELQYETNE